jgi:hypothetical protein
VHGSVAAGYEAVHEAFVENFRHRAELGAGCCVYHHGRKAVDLWGGVRNRANGEPWEEHTMALVHSRGWLDYALAGAAQRTVADQDVG